MHCIVVNDLLVDFIGEKDQILLPRKFDDIQEQLTRIHSAGWIVWIDNDDAARACSDFALQVVDIGLPVGLLVAAIMDCFAAAQRNRGGPEWIVGRRNEDFIPV